MFNPPHFKFWHLIAALISWLGLTWSATAQTSVSLAKYAPSKDLLVYLEFDGIGAHDLAWKKLAAQKLLTKTPLGALLKDLAHQGIEGGLKNMKGEKPTVAEIDALLDHLVRNGFVFAVFGPDPDHTRFVLAIRDAGNADFKKLVDRGLALSAPGPLKTKVLAKRKCTILGAGKDTGTLWYEGNDLVLTASDSFEGVLATITGKAEDASKNPNYLELRKTDDFTPALVVFLDIKEFPTMPREASRLGLDGLTRVDYRWGFQDDAVVGVLKIAAPSPRRGLLSLMDQPTFDINTLPPLPPKQDQFIVASLDPGKTYDQSMTMLKAAFPDRAPEITRFEENLGKILKMDFRHDFLGRMGSKWTILGGTDPNAESGFSVIIPITDADAFGKAIDPLMAAMNQGLAARANAPGAPRGPGASAQAPQFRKLKGVRPSYTITAPPRANAAGSMTPTQINVQMAKDRLVISLHRSTNKGTVPLPANNGPRWTPSGPTAKATERLPKPMTLLVLDNPTDSISNAISALRPPVPAVNGPGSMAGTSPINFTFKVNPSLVPQPAEIAKYVFPNTLAVVVDTKGARVVSRDSFPNLVTGPAVGVVAVALLLPAVQSAREAARRAQCSNNLKQIMLGMMKHENGHKALPARAIVNQAGTPILSWRVAILPFIGELDLHTKFRLNEPWDSPHNKALLAEMPAIYRCPSCPVTDPTHTNYHVYGGPGTLLEASRGVKLNEITDGTSTTISVVESKHGVPWTKPEDIPFDPNGQIIPGSAFHPGLFNAAFADGSVKPIKLPVDLDFLRSLITRAGGERVGNPTP